VFVPKKEAAKVKELQRQLAKKPKKKSKTRQRIVLRLRSHARRHQRRLRTRAQQDAAWLVKRPGVRLVATEPNVMVQRLLGQIKELDRPKLIKLPIGADPKEFYRQKHRQKMLKRRLHETGFAARLNHIKRLTDVRGILYLQPDYRGSTQDCSWCGIKVPKTLVQRRHVCPNCGVDVDRDHNAGRNLLARALRKFILSPDPDCMIKQLLSEREEALGKKQESYDRRQNGLKKRWDAYRQKKLEAAEAAKDNKSDSGDVVIPSAERLRNIRHEEIQTETLPKKWACLSIP
jgi:predicted RNA-binding Zn-ribbon protein involved in translation (DUF1610 family)